MSTDDPKFFNLTAIEETARSLASLLVEREKRLKEAYPNEFPPLPLYSEDDDLGRAIASFWEIYG